MRKEDQEAKVGFFDRPSHQKALAKIDNWAEVQHGGGARVTQRYEPRVNSKPIPGAIDQMKFDSATVATVLHSWGEPALLRAYLLWRYPRSADRQGFGHKASVESFEDERLEVFAKTCGMRDWQVWKMLEMIEREFVLAVERFLRGDRPRRWAREFDCCQACGRDDRPHHGNGLCKPCSKSSDREAKKPVTNAEYLEHVGATRNDG